VLISDAGCQYFGWDAVMDVALSRNMQFVKSGFDVGGQIQSLHSLLLAAAFAGLYPSIPILINHPLWWPALSPKPTAKSGIGAIQGIAVNSVSDRFNNPDPTKTDIIQWMIEHRDRDGNALSQARIGEEAMAPVLAGSDTTASTLRSMILRTVANPRVYNKLMSQIDTADRSGLLSVPPTHAEILRHVPYIEAIRKEALRLLPASALPFFREAPAKGATIEGYFIPGGTDVGLQHWAIARNPLYWGDDYDLFRPERWTDEQDKHRRKMRDLGDVFFADGVYKCTGRNLATMEIMKMPIELFRRFDVELLNPDKPWKEKGALAMLHSDFWVKLTPRAKSGQEQ
jgi:cytochrome P450